MKKGMFTTLWLFLTLFSLAQTPSLTTRQIMDFAVGDQFHYRFEHLTPGGNTYKIMRKIVLEKLYNLDSTTVTYTIETLTYTKYLENGPWKIKQIDTALVTYAELDAIAFSLFPNPNAFVFASYCNDDYFDNPVFYEYTDAAWGGRKVLRGSSGTLYELNFGEGLGEVKRSAAQQICQENMYLVYAKKGAITLGTADTTLLTAPPIQTIRFLTVGEVYDFQVGDVFQFHSQSFGAGYNYTYIVEQKILSRATYADSLVYDIWEKDSVIYQFGVNKESHPIGKSIHQVYLNPDKLVIDINQSYALDGYIDSCGAIYFNHYLFQSSTHELSQMYYEGLGTYISTKGYDFPATSGFENKLVYFLKVAQNNSCGEPFEFTHTPPPDTTDKNQLFFFSPSEKAIHLQLGAVTNPATLAVYDLTGKQLMKQTAIQKNELYLLSTQGIAQGIYLVCLSQDKGDAWYKIWVY